MHQVFNAEFDLRYRASSGSAQDGRGRTLQVAINRAVVQVEGSAPDLGTELDLSLDLGRGNAVEVHGVVQACDGDRVALGFPRYTAEVGQVLAAASRQR